MTVNGARDRISSLQSELTSPFHHACVTKGFLYTHALSCVFLSLPHTPGGQKRVLMLLTGEVTGEWEGAGRLVLIQGHPGGKHLADRGLAWVIQVC